MGLVNDSLLHSFKEIEKEIMVSKQAINQFSEETGIDKKIAKEIILSWRDFLKKNYMFLNIQGCLERKRNKYPENPAYAIVKNNSTFLKSSIILKKIVDEFIQKGDYAGCHSIQKIHDPEEHGIMLDTFSNLIFRRISKLGILWSGKVKIPLDFFSHVNLEKISKNRCQSDYQRVVYSEYNFIKRKMETDQQAVEHVSIKEPIEALKYSSLLPFSSILEILGANIEHFEKTKNPESLIQLLQSTPSKEDRSLSRADLLLQLLSESLSSLHIEPESFFQSKHVSQEELRKLLLRLDNMPIVNNLVDFLLSLKGVGFLLPPTLDDWLGSFGGFLLHRAASLHPLSTG